MSAQPRFDDVNATAMRLLADAIRSDDPFLCQVIARSPGISVEDADHFHALCVDAWRDALNLHKEKL